jgi:signal transduction histidine kinase
VAGARQTQRLQLARDLHDFVAHDISGMLAQAQAGQILAQRDPAGTGAAFRRIEQAATRALSSMDHTLRMLGDDGADGSIGRAPLPTLAELTDLVDRFAAAGTARVRLHIDPELTGAGAAAGPPREVAATIYRVVVEALTNVRRHAAQASRVEVSLRRTAVGFAVTITDDGAAPAAGPIGRRGGLGLPGLAERVQALGGTLTAGPAESGGWRVAVVLPASTVDR